MGISYYTRVVASVTLRKDQVEGFDGDSSTDLASWLAGRCGSEVVCVLRGEGDAYDDFFETIDFVVASGGEPPSPKRGRRESDSKEEEENEEEEREYYDDHDGTAHLRCHMKYAEDNADDPGFWRDNATVILEDNTTESYKGKKTTDHVEVGPFANYCFPVRSVEVTTLMNYCAAKPTASWAGNKTILCPQPARYIMIRLCWFCFLRQVLRQNYSSWAY